MKSLKLVKDYFALFSYLTTILIVNNMKGTLILEGSMSEGIMDHFPKELIEV